MVKTISHIVIPLIVVLGLMTQFIMPHHHHHEEICFAKNHNTEQHVHIHEHGITCSHAHDIQAACADEHDDADETCCYIKTMNYVTPQTKKDNIQIMEIDIRFLSLFILNEGSCSTALNKFIPEYEPPEQIYAGYFIVQDLCFRGPPVC